MSWSVNLLIMSKISPLAVAEDISKFLKLPFEKMDSDEDVYFLDQLEANIVVGTNNFINDRDLNFESYDVLVTIWSTKLPDWQASEEECKKIGIRLFETFRDTYRTGLLLTEQAQTRLLAFDPASNSSQ